MITIGSVILLNSPLHHLPIEGDYANEPMRTSVYGTRGLLEITDELHGRQITIDITLGGYGYPTDATPPGTYTTLALLKAARDTLDSRVSQAATSAKTLVVVMPDASSLSYYHCTLDAVARRENPLGVLGPWYDGSGRHKWLENLALVFQQLDATA